MFGFDRPEDGSRERYKDRFDLWEGVNYGVLYHFAWWLFHNCISHPLIGFFPFKPLFKLHDWTSHQMHNKKDTPKDTATAFPEDIPLPEPLRAVFVLFSIRDGVFFTFHGKVLWSRHTIDAMEFNTREDAEQQLDVIDPEKVSRDDVKVVRMVRHKLVRVK